MNKIILSSLFILPFICSGQQLDSLDIMREVDQFIIQGDSLLKIGKFEDGIKSAELAQKLLSENFENKGNIKLADCLDIIGVCYAQLGDLNTAEGKFLEGKSIRERILSKEHQDLAKSLGNLAQVYHITGRYIEAESLLREALLILGNTFGKNSVDYARVLSNLGIINDNLGNYEFAEFQYKEALRIYQLEKVDKNSLVRANTMNNLGILYEKMGRQDLAEPLHLEANAIRKQLFGEINIYYINSVVNLAIIQIFIGKYEVAETNLKLAKELIEKHFSNNHYDYINVIHNLGYLYLNTQDYELAEQYFKEASQVEAAKGGRKTLSYANAIYNLGRVYEKTGKLDASLLEYRESVNILRQFSEDDHHYYGQSIESIGRIMYKNGNFEEAESNFLEARKIYRESVGRNNIDYLRVQKNLGILYWENGQIEKAASILTESNALAKLQIQRARNYWSERELQHFMKMLIKTSDEIISCFSDNSIDDLSAFAYDDALFFKNFLQRSASELIDLIGRTNDEEIRNLYFEWQGLNREITRKYTDSVNNTSEIKYSEEKADELEKSLIQKLNGVYNKEERITNKEIINSLGNGEAAIEFIHYQYYDPHPTDSTFYAALVLRPEDTFPHFVPLFEEKELQQLIDFDYGYTQDQVNNLYRPPSKKVPSSLYELIWQPLEKLLGKSHTLYVAPSGLLHRINLSAVRINKKQAWMDRHQVITLGSTRQLVTGEMEAENLPLTAQLYGGIQYEMDSLAIADAVAVFEEPGKDQEELSFSHAERGERGLSWDYLPGSEREVDRAGALVEEYGGKASILKGYAATEESFKQLGRHQAAPRILHIATHGYFQANPEEEVRLEPGFDQMPAFKISDHPMIRSGLVFAGGNHAWRDKPSISGIEDGILTAYEVSQVNLRNTKLVVLSACDTGLGDIKGDEGVYGLQRAFKIAGARYLLMSLWPVPDEQTQELMVAFYRNWLEKKMTIPNAFSAAQEGMRKKYREHYFWAAFVLLE